MEKMSAEGQADDIEIPSLNLSEENVKLLSDANDILENGILVETDKGLYCMSLNDAISSNMNLSSDDLQSVATQLILNTKQNLVIAKASAVPDLRITCDSDGGFSSECSDSTYTTTASSSTYPMITKVSLSSDEILLNSCLGRPKDRIKSSEESDSTRGSLTVLSEEGCPKHPHQILPKKKGRGGWPKGRKRKPELLNLPPKAPATGYNLYLNEQRSYFKNSSLQFYEITKIIGNRWSSLTLEEKKPYLDRAEEDKKRYREELKQYRQSEAYRAYLNKKRRVRLQHNVLSESDMDATDDFDEEDNEELYCRTCDQWFHSLHNKREHLLAKKHLNSLAGDINRELSDADTSSAITVKTDCSMDESSLESSNFVSQEVGKTSTTSVYDAMCQLLTLVQQQENEVKTLKNRHQESIEENKALLQQFHQLNERETTLRKDLALKQEKEKELETQVFQLWQVPSLFVMSSFDNLEDGATDLSEGTS